MFEPNHYAPEGFRLSKQGYIGREDTIDLPGREKVLDPRGTSGQTRLIFRNLTVELFFLPCQFANAKIVCQPLGQQSVSLGSWMRIALDAKALT